MGLSLEGCFIRCAYGANKTQHRYRTDLEVAQSLKQAFGRRIDLQRALDKFFLVSGPTMNVTIWANRGPNVLDMSDNLHLAKLLTVI